MFHLHGAGPGLIEARSLELGLLDRARSLEGFHEVCGVLDGHDAVQELFLDLAGAVNEPDGYEGFFNFFP